MISFFISSVVCYVYRIWYTCNMQKFVHTSQPRNVRVPEIRRKMYARNLYNILWRLHIQIKHCWYHISEICKFLYFPNQFFFFWLKFENIKNDFYEETERKWGAWSRLAFCFNAITMDPEQILKKIVILTSIAVDIKKPAGDVFSFLSVM